MILVAIFVIAFLVFCGLTAAGRQPQPPAVKHNELLGKFFATFLVWLLGPVERLLVGRVSPNAVTTASLVLCAVTGVAAGTGHLPGAAWIYTVAGVLDVLDGRLARLGGKQTKAGALFDSVSDRWGELFVFSGFAWYLHDSAWMLAVFAAVGGSMMVSYTRARAEGLGLQLTGGIMQRAERIVVVVLGALIAGWYAADPENLDVVAPILGTSMLICGVASTATAVHRWIIAYRELMRRAAPVVEPVATAEPVIAQPAPRPKLAVRPLEHY